MNPRHARAQILLSQERYDLALRECGEALADDPNDGTILGIMALCHLGRDEFDRAQELAMQAIGSRPDDPFVHTVIARVMLERNRLEEAEAAARTAISLDPHETSYHVLLGLIAFRQERFQLALAAAEQALMLDPENTNAFNLRAAARKKLGDTAAAQTELQEALQVDPEDPWTHANMGWTMLERGNNTKAEEHFREALRLDPEFDWARLGVIESIKATSPMYRWWLDYRFWLSNHTSWAQWAIVLGIFFGYRVIRWLGSLDPWMGVAVVPLIAAYFLFVLTSILARPMTNLFLRLHPFGSLALNDEERTEANLVGAIIGVGLAAFAVYYFSPWIFLAALLLPIWISCAALIFPVALVNGANEGQPRTIMSWYAIGVAVACALYVGALYVPLVLKIFAPDSDWGWSKGGWIAERYGDWTSWLILAGVASTWGINIVNSIRFTR